MRSAAITTLVVALFLILPSIGLCEPPMGNDCRSCHTVESQGRFEFFGVNVWADPTETAGAEDYGRLPVFQVQSDGSIDLEIEILAMAEGDSYAARINGFDAGGVTRGVSIRGKYATDCTWGEWGDSTYADPLDQYIWPYGPALMAFHVDVLASATDDYYPLIFAVAGRDDVTGDLFFEEKRFYLQVTDDVSAWLPGDLDCDNDVDSADVDDFVEALLDWTSYGENHDGEPYAPCNPWRADVNDDSVVNGDDIQAFVERILG